MAGAQLIARLSPTDYADDLVVLAESLDTSPMFVELSRGGLLAQLVAARTPHLDVIAAAPSPAAEIFAAYPAML